MYSRLIHLEKSVQALYETGCYFLIKAQNSYFSVAKTSDDVGLYYFVPFIVKNFNLSLSIGIDYFFYGLLGIGFFFALLSSFLIGGIGAVLFSCSSFFLVYREGFFVFKDVYIANVFITFFVIPFTLYLLDNCKILKDYHYLWMFVVGVAMSYSDYLRVYSSLPVLIFFIGYLLFINRKIRIFLFIPLLLGLLIPHFHFSYIQRQSVDFLIKNNTEITSHKYKHCFWHAIYCGLGFVEDSQLKIKFDDSCAANKVKEFSSTAEIGSMEYEEILKKEVLRLCVKERFTIAKIFFMKLGVIFFFLLVCVNIGLFAAYFYPKGAIEYVFFVAIATAALPGILVQPSLAYLTGFISFVFIYGIYSVVFAFKEIFKKDNFKILFY